MHPRSQAISTAAFAVSWTVAPTFTQLDCAIYAMAWSFVMFNWPARKAIVS